MLVELAIVIGLLEELRSVCWLLSGGDWRGGNWRDVPFEHIQPCRLICNSSIYFITKISNQSTGVRRTTLLIWISDRGRKAWSTLRNSELRECNQPKRRENHNDRKYLQARQIGAKASPRHIIWIPRCLCVCCTGSFRTRKYRDR